MGILTLIGLRLAGGRSGLVGAIGRWWPAVLILIGLYILVQRSQAPNA